MTSAMPTGGVDGSDGADGGTPSASAGWLPAFHIGGENPGVYGDARGLISGQTSATGTGITATNVAAAGDAMYQESAAVGATGGVGPLDVGGPPSGGAASSLPTGGAGPTAKATTQAQRDANNAAAAAENPGYQGAG